jgi:hypothetical protein
MRRIGLVLALALSVLVAPLAAEGQGWRAWRPVMCAVPAAPAGMPRAEVGPGAWMGGGGAHAVGERGGGR